MPSRFSWDDYSRDPAYPAVVEARLTTTPIPASNILNLAHYTEASFPGYSRVTGPRGSLFRPSIAGPQMVNLDLRGITWTAGGGFPVAVTAVLIVATFPSESPLLVAVIPAPYQMTAELPTICLAGTFQTDRVTL